MCQIIFVIHLKLNPLLPGSFLKFWGLRQLPNSPKGRAGPDDVKPGDSIANQENTIIEVKIQRIQFKLNKKGKGKKKNVILK